MPRKDAFDTERINRGIGVTDWFKDVRAITKLVRALAVAGYTVDAERIASEIEDFDRDLGISMYYDRIEAMNAVVQSLVAVGQHEDAQRLAHFADGAARRIFELDSKFAYSSVESREIIEVAQTLAAIGQTVDAERLGLLALTGPAWVRAVQLFVHFRWHEDWPRLFYHISGSSLPRSAAP